MVTFSEGLANAVKAGICETLGNYDDALRYIGNIPLIGSAANFLNVAGPLRANLCDKPIDDVNIPPPPFTGGQCCGVEYQYTYSFRNPNTGTIQDSIQTITNAQILGLFERSNQPAQPTKSGGPILRNCATGQIQELPLGTTFESSDLEQSISNIIRTDGLPDDCGDPDPPVPPLQPVEFDIDFTYNDGDTNVDIDIDGRVIVGPSFSTGDFNLRVPVRIDLGGFNFSGYADLSPEFNLVVAPRISFGGSGNIDDPSPGPDPNPEDTEPVPPYQDEPKIIGIVVRAVRIGTQQSTDIAVDNMPNIQAPRLGSASFAIESGLTIAWTPDQDIKNADCYIPCPEPRGAVAFGVDAAPGWSITGAAVRGFPLT